MAISPRRGITLPMDGPYQVKARSWVRADDGWADEVVGVSVTFFDGERAVTIMFSPAELGDLLLGLEDLRNDHRP